MRGLCRQIHESGAVHTDRVETAFPEVAAARELGLRSFASVPLHDRRGNIAGTLCGASRGRVELAADAEQVMRSYARLIESRLQKGELALRA